MKKYSVTLTDAERIALSGPVDRRFTTEDVRVKLKRRYPSIDG